MRRSLTNKHVAIRSTSGKPVPLTDSQYAQSATVEENDKETASSEDIDMFESEVDDLDLTGKTSDDEDVKVCQVPFNLHGALMVAYR